VLAAMKKPAELDLGSRPRRAMVVDVTDRLCLRSYSAQVVLGCASAKITLKPIETIGSHDPVLRVCVELQYVEPPEPRGDGFDGYDDTWEVTPKTNLRVMVYDVEGRVVAVGDELFIKVGKSAPLTGVQVELNLCAAGGLGEILVIAGDV